MGNCIIRTGCEAKFHHDGCPASTTIESVEPGIGRIKPGETRLFLDERARAAMSEMVDWRLGPGRLFNYALTPPTELARRIAEQHMPEAMDHFFMRNAEYGDDDDFNLGSRGQYVDISRKVQKLKRRLWEGEPEPDEGMGESNKVIVMELIGHLLMTMDYMEQEEGDKEDGADQG